MDVPLKVTVEIGSTKMLASEILAMRSGMVIELDKLAGEALEIMINDSLMALGEVIVVNDRFGVRLTDLITPQHVTLPSKS